MPSLACCVCCPNSAVSLQSMSMFKSSWLLPIWGMILMSGLAFVWSVCAMSIVYAVDNGSSDGPRSVRGLIFFILVLSLFWTILTIKGWVHTCVAGVQATWSVSVTSSAAAAVGLSDPDFRPKTILASLLLMYVYRLSSCVVFALSSPPLLSVASPPQVFPCTARPSEQSRLACRQTCINHFLWFHLLRCIHRRIHSHRSVSCGEAWESGRRIVLGGRRDVSFVLC